MFHFLPSHVIDHGRQNPSEEAYQLHVGPMRQESRGWLKLKSRDPREHPVINPNYLSTGKSINEFISCTSKSGIGALVAEMGEKVWLFVSRSEDG
jgi:choline dehydrogenase